MLSPEAIWPPAEDDGWQALTEAEHKEQIRVRGQALFQAVFRDDILACLGQSLVEARDNHCGLRIKLRLNETPELIALPWEYLFHPTLDRFLALSAETTLVHYLDLPRKVSPLSVSLPLHILAVMATPKDLPWLDGEEEWRVLHEAMSHLIKTGAVTVERLDMANLHDLQGSLRTRSYHMLHFIGHGVFTKAMGEGALMFCGQDGCAAPVQARDLALVVSDVPSLRLVVLNGCQGALVAPTDPFSGVAQTLVQQGTPAVLAMHSAISDQAAITLTREFYGALADGQPVDAALAEARKAIATQLRSLEWGVPRLVMHAADGQLWNIHAARASKDVLAVHAMDNSLAILAALIRHPDFNAKLVALQTDFEAASSQIKLLTNYKDLHDLLHNLQYLCFSGLVQEARRFPEDPLALDILLDHELTLGGLIDSLMEVALRPAMPAGELDWIQELVEAHAQLQLAIGARDAEPLHRAIWLTKRVLDRHPTRINERLNAAARALRLVAIEQSMLSIRKDLRRLKLAPQQVRRFESGVTALGDLGEHLTQLVEDHDRWQAIDLELRRVEAVMAHDPGEIRASWPELRAKVDPLCQQSGAAWAEWIRRDSRDLDKALVSKNPTQIRQCFQRYRRRVGNRFYQVDTDLKSLCHELRFVGQPLAATFALLSS
ncbi:MAG TPA: CHAT domain-containing protein [Anaerolineae bacterium]|nr:CHAT domain-containing protein [Anaerolineae bacterium]